MNYYLSVLDKTERRENENPSIGIILCTDKDNVEVELALENVRKPIGVAEYQLIIPKDELQKLLIEELQLYEKDVLSSKVEYFTLSHTYCFGNVYGISF